MAAAADHWKKALRMVSLSLFRRGFNPSKCKTMAKMAVARVKLLRNKREVVIKLMRRDIAMLLESGQDSTARIRVEHVIREQNVFAANELIELFCELVVARLSIIAKQRECPADLKEGISSLIFAAPRCSDIPELLSIRDVFQKKYGKDFVSTATDLRPNAGVNRMLIEKLSVKTPSGEIKLKVLKEIAKEYQVQWDTTESEEELLKPPEERIEGPNTFVSATSLPIKPAPKQCPEPNTASMRGQSNITSFQELASAAGFAAQKAHEAAEAAAQLAAYGGNQNLASHHGVMNEPTVRNFNNTISRNSSSRKNMTTNRLTNSEAGYPTGDQFDDDQRVRKANRHPHFSVQNEQSVHEYSTEDQFDGQRIRKANRHPHFSVQNEQSVNDARKMFRRQSYNCERGPHTDIKFDESDCDEKIEMDEPPRSMDNPGKFNRRHSYNIPPTQSGVRYDEPVYDEIEDEIDELEQQPTRGNMPPERPPPRVPGQRVHPKLPDYEDIAARFEALKHNRSQPK